MNTVTKFFLFISIVSAVAVSCGEKGPSDESGDLSTAVIDPENPPVIQYKDTIFDFGTISQGEIVKFTFYFTNTGKSDLVLQDVHPSCGCTVPKNWPKHPIKPGERGEIDVQFDSAGKQGKINKSIRVVANTKPTVSILRLTGTVMAPSSGGN